MASDDSRRTDRTPEGPVVEVQFNASGEAIHVRLANPLMPGQTSARPYVCRYVPEGSLVIATERSSADSMSQDQAIGFLRSLKSGRDEGQVIYQDTIDHALAALDLLRFRARALIEALRYFDESPSAWTESIGRARDSLVELL